MRQSSFIGRINIFYYSGWYIVRSKQKSHDVPETLFGRNKVLNTQRGCFGYCFLSPAVLLSRVEALLPCKHCLYSSVFKARIALLQCVIRTLCILRCLVTTLQGCLGVDLNTPLFPNLSCQWSPEVQFWNLWLIEAHYQN